MTTVVRFYRLQFVLNLVAPVSLYTLVGVGYITGLLGSILPYTGGVAMSYYFAKKTKTSYKKIFSIFLFDYMITFVVTFIIGLIGLIYFIQKKALTYSPNYYLLLGIIIAIFLFCFFGLYFIKKLYYKNFSSSIKRVYHFVSSAKYIIVPFILLTILLIIISIIQTFIIYSAFRLYPSIFDLIMAVNLMSVIGYIPGVLLKIGQEEAIGVLILPYLLELDKNVVFTLIFTTRILFLVSSVILGLLFFYFLKVDMQMLRSIRIKGVTKDV